MKQFNLKRWAFSLLLLISCSLLSNKTFAQLTGVKNVPGDYADLALAITDLNTQGVGAGGVTINLVAGNPQTAPAGGYSITASGTVANPITFTGNANIVTAPAQTAGQLFDGVVKIVGGDFITIQGFTLNEHAILPVTAAATNNMTEWGIALLYATTTNGCQNVSILNNTIALGATYQNAFGIYANSTHAAGTPTTSASATTVTGGNNNLSIKGNTISSVNMGIVVVGPTAATDHNDVVTIGGTTAPEGNTITFGLTSGISAFANVSGTVNGILVRNSKNATVSRNSLTSNGTVTAGTLNGIQFPLFSNAPTGTFTQNVNNNSISLRSNIIAGVINGIQLNGTSASITSSVNVNDNNFFNFDHATATGTGVVTFISQVGSHLNTSISNNTFSNITLKTTGAVTFVAHSYTMPANGTQVFNNNSIVTQFTKSGAGGAIVGFTTNGSSPNTSTATYTNNNFSNVTFSGAATFVLINNTDGGAGSAKTITGNVLNNITGGTGGITGMNLAYFGNVNSLISNNSLSNITSQGTIVGFNIGNSASGASPAVFRNNSINSFTSNGVGGTVTGIFTSNTGSAVLFENNTIHSLSSTFGGNVIGINVGGGLPQISRNKIYNLSNSNANPGVFGVFVSAATTPVIVNNVIGDLKAPNANAANPVIGINITSGSLTTPGVSVINNSVYLDATSVGALFGTSAISASVTPFVTLNNNLFINNSTFNGTGITAAYRRSGVSLTTYNIASNRNSFFAGTPGANNLLFFDGTTGDQTFVAYQLRLLLAGISADGNSFSETQPYATTYFTSLTGSSVDYLKPAPATVTQAESGATNIPGIIVDYANITRQGNAGYVGTGTAPDCGAFEFEGVTPAPQITINSITPAGNACVNVARLVSVNITTASGTVTGATLAYAINGTAQAPIPMSNTAGTTWEATIPVVVPANAAITWGVTATNSLGLSSSILGTPYTDEPLTGSTGTATASLTTVCAGSPSSLSATLALSGAGPVGTPGVASANFPDVPLNHAYGGAKTQYIYRASELIAAGFSAGNITNLSYNVTAIGTTPLNAFTIDMGNTAQNNAVANVAITSGLTNVYTNAAQPVTLGTNNFLLSTPFSWDGTSNIVVSFVYSNNNAGGTSSTLTSSTASFVSTMGIRADNTTATCLYGAVASTDACVNLTNTNATSSIRPLITFTGNRAPAITSVTWMNGVTTVGTGNPLIVNPVTTTTYTANITAAGCVLSPSPTVMVNVNPVNVALTPINISCNGLTDGSFSLGTVTCGVAPFTYSVDAGVYGAIPTNLTLGSHTILVKDNGGFISAPVMITITQPAIVGTPTVPTNAIVCQNDLSAMINATGSGSMVITIPLSASGDEINAAPGNTIGSGMYTAIPAGTSITSATLTVNGMIPNGADYQTDVKLGFSGAINDPATLASSGVGLLGAGTVSGSPYNYTRPITAGLINPAGGAFNLLYWNDFEDVAGAADATFPATATLTINFAGSGAFSSISWWNAASAGTNLGTTSPFEAVGTTVLPTTATAGTYTFYAQGQNGLCASPTRLPVTVKVNANSTASVAQTACGSYTWTQTGMTYSASGMYMDTIPNAAGCDSIITLNLTINIPSSATVAQTACSSYTWTQTGMTYTTSGMFMDTIPNAAGCDSIITLNLTINNSSSSSVSQTACTSFTWAQNGMTYTSSGAFNDTILNAAGCDSIITLNLTINNATSSTVIQTACGSYTWIQTGMIYSTSGMYMDTIPNTAGCDSVITLNLTINTPSSATLIESACGTYIWAQNGMTYTSTGMYMDTIPNASGCDSIITLNLTIFNSSASSVSQTACSSFTWAQNGMMYTTSGMYMDTIPNVAGCDSIITLNLTINSGGSSSITQATCGTFTWTQTGITYTSSGVYNDTIVGGSLNGCDSIVTLNLTITPNPIANAGINSMFCQGASITPNGTGGTTNTWSGPVSLTNGVPVVLPAGTHTFVLTSTNGACSDIDSVVYIVNPTPIANAGVDVTICLGTTVTLNGTGGTTNTWTGPVAVTNGTAFTPPVGVHTFILTATLATGCFDKDTVLVTVNALPTATATYNNDSLLTASTGTSYQWINCAGNTVIAGATSQTYQATANGSYAVVVTNAAGCSDTSTCVAVGNLGIKGNTLTFVNVYPNPTSDEVTVEMSAENAIVTVTDAAGKTIQVVNIVSGAKINLATYQTGVYFLNISTTNGNSIQRVVKN